MSVWERRRRLCARTAETKMIHFDFDFPFPISSPLTHIHRHTSLRHAWKQNERNNNNNSKMERTQEKVSRLHRVRVIVHIAESSVALADYLFRYTSFVFIPLLSSFLISFFRLLSDCRRHCCYFSCWFYTFNSVSFWWQEPVNFLSLFVYLKFTYFIPWLIYLI